MNKIEHVLKSAVLDEQYWCVIEVVLRLQLGRSQFETAAAFFEAVVIAWNS